MESYRACLCIKGLGLSFGITPSSPIQKHAITPQVVLYYKKAMSELQVTVEWLFGREGNYFKLFIDFKNLLRVNMSAVGKFYIVCAPLCKVHTPVCMAILFQTSLVFHLLLCGSIFKEAQGLTAVWAQLILKDSCGTCVITLESQ